MGSSRPPPSSSTQEGNARAAKCGVLGDEGESLAPGLGDEHAADYPCLKIPRLEVYAAGRLQEGRSLSEDAFLVLREEAPVVALCDGAGAAERVARRALALFERLVREAPAEDLGRFPAWSGWVGVRASKRRPRRSCARPVGQVACGGRPTLRSTWRRTSAKSGCWRSGPSTSGKK